MLMQLLKIAKKVTVTFATDANVKKFQLLQMVQCYYYTILSLKTSYTEGSQKTDLISF